ncbi:MAG: hypothetical protein JWL64_1536 [Frankiales bacterium]|nr:hypothetical protein [Frankiales bacterium]
MYVTVSPRCRTRRPRPGADRAVPACAPLPDQALGQAASAAWRFYALVQALTSAEVDALARARGALTPLALECDGDFLELVAGGRWTPDHAGHLEDLRRGAQACASALSLAPWRRRRLAAVLEGVALVVLTDADGRGALPDRLRSRLLLPWADALGRSVPLAA